MPCSPSLVGEPLNDEAWLWYNNVVGGGKCTVVDTWWQTGTYTHEHEHEHVHVLYITLAFCYYLCNNLHLLYDYYCMSNLIGPLLGTIFPYCTGTGGYCTVRVVVMETSHSIKKNCSASWHAWADL